MSLELRANRNFKVRGLNFAGKEWGIEGDTPVLALHGWLDNCASFDAVAGFLDDVHLLAMDCAGHAETDFRSPDSAYNIWQDVLEMLDIVGQMGWDRFALMGHSRGAIISNLIAGAFPDRVTHLVLIDGGMPPPVDPAHAPMQLARAYKSHMEYTLRQPTLFATYEKAVEGRMSGFLSVSADAAKVLAARGVRQSDQGFYWHQDQRLKADSEFKLTAEHIRGFVSSVTAPTLLIYASEGVIAQHKAALGNLGWFKRLKQVELPGGHHLHMEKSARLVAGEIQRFLESQDGS